MSDNAPDDLPFSLPDFSGIKSEEEKQKAISWYLMTSNEWMVKEQAHARNERARLEKKIDTLLTQLKMVLWIFTPIYGALIVYLFCKLK